MADLVSDGMPFETPLGAADQSYAAIAPSLGAEFTAARDESSPLDWLTGLARRATVDPDAGGLRAVLGALGASAAPEQAGLFGEGSGSGAPVPYVATPMLTPEEYNKRYAPPGTSIGDQPMPEGLAQAIGDDKRAEIERDGVLARYGAAHAWPTTFAVGAVAALTDPLNLAAAFVPGFGEEAIAAGLGRAGLASGGIAARTLARLGAGASAGAAAQLPLSALRLGISDYEGADYDLRDALREVAFGAAANAVLHTGFGSAGDLLRRAPGGAPEATAGAPIEAADAAPILAADAATRDAAMRGAVAQLVDGRAVEAPTAVEQALAPAADIVDLAERQRVLWRTGFAAGVPEHEFEATDAALFGPSGSAAADGAAKPSAEAAGAPKAPDGIPAAPNASLAPAESGGANSAVPTVSPTTAAAAIPSPLPNQVAAFAPGELAVDAQRFQFKSGGDAAGASERLRGVEQWDPIKAGMAIVYEDADGRHYIVDGHQRLALARRVAAADPAQQPLLHAWVLRRADGVSDAEARVIAAAKNIAEGTGTAVDAAKVLRDRPELLTGLPPRSELVRQARGLVNLDGDGFGMVINDVVPANYAAIVGRLVPAAAPLQHALLDLLAKTEPENATQAEAVVRQGIAAGLHTETQGSLFGDREVATSLYGDRARVLDRALKHLRRDRRVFQALVHERDIIAAIGNRLAEDANTRRATTDGQALQILQILASRRGPVSDALTAAARRARDSGNTGGAVREFVAAIRREAESGDLARLADGVERGNGDAGGEGAPGDGLDRDAVELNSAQEAQATAAVEAVLHQAEAGVAATPTAETAPQRAPELREPGLFDAEIAAAEQRLAAVADRLGDDGRAELAASAQAQDAAERRAGAYDEAASCLAERGL